MSGWKEHWKALLAFALILWLVLYLVAWNHRVDCGQMSRFPCAAGALLTFGADFVMLEWVDTTLGAGLLAIIAALTIFANAAIERAHRRADEVSARKRNLFDMIQNVRVGFRRVAIHITAGHPDDVVSTTLASLENDINRLAGDHEPLASQLFMFCGYARIFYSGVSKKNKDAADLARKQADAYCEMGYAYLTDGKRFLDGPGLSPATINEKTKGVLRWDLFDEDTHARLGNYFIFV